MELDNLEMGRRAFLAGAAASAAALAGWFPMSSAQGAQPGETPAGLPRYTVGQFRGKPTLMVNGKPTPLFLYCYPLDMDLAGAREIHDAFIRNGCRHFTINVRGNVGGDWHTTPFWLDDGVFPESSDPKKPLDPSLTEQARLILDQAPDAKLWVRYHCMLPKGYVEKNPDEMLLNSYGTRYREPSLASEKTFVQIRRFISSIVKFVESQPWASSVAGYLVYPLGEGATVMTAEGFLFDQSPVAQTGFRRYLTEKYGNDRALQAAWGRPDVTLKTVTVPKDQDYFARGQTRPQEIDTTTEAVFKPAPRRLHWPDPQDTAPERDYCLYMRDMTVRSYRAMLEPVRQHAPTKLALIDAFKQTMLGWPLVARWTGDYKTHAGSQHPVTGGFGMSEMLDMDCLDGVATPHDYLNRSIGFGYEPEGIGDSVVLHGRLMLVEEDTRTFTVHEHGRWNPLKAGAELEAGLWRNAGSSISRGFLTYPMDVVRPSFFMSDQAQAILRDRRRVQEAATFWEHHDVPCIAMILDDWSVLDEDFTFGYQNLAVIQQRLYGLSRAGLPYRIYLFDDLYRKDFPTQHKVYLFPNLFRYEPRRLAVLREKLMRDGNMLIWGPATGLTDGRTHDGEHSRNYTGMNMLVRKRETPRVVTIDQFEHPLTRGLARLDYGDSFPYGPILWPLADDGSTVLGNVQFPFGLGAPGLLIKEFGRGCPGNGRAGPRGAGDYASVFTTAVPLPGELLRSMARYAGAHIYCETDDIVCADKLTLTVHCARPGPRTVKLPSASPVWDLVTGQRISEKSDTIRFECNGPLTRVFYLGQDPAIGRG